MLRIHPFVEGIRGKQGNLRPVVESSGVVRAAGRLGLALAIVLVVVPAAMARTFYVAPYGHDYYSGRSPQAPWRTVFRVDKARLRPGDVVLFEGGARFTDDALMPGWGLSVDGSPHRPVVFGSFGSGRATLTQGIWIKHERHLAFEDLNLGPQGAIEGIGGWDAVENCSFTPMLGGVQIAINVLGSGWLIEGNQINGTGNSGMLLRGNHFAVIGNAIYNTGLNNGLDFGTHGIYLNASYSMVSGNTIVHFRNNGVSDRGLGNVVTHNTIDGGQFGIAYFQYKRGNGTSHWTDNTISGANTAGIYVSPSDIGGPTHENFVIVDNRIFKPLNIRADEALGWRALSLSHDDGHYMLRGNAVL